jgi:menaquinone-dependent protoporphyrinogen oxidase
MSIPVFYATTHGQTRRIAERIAGVLSTEGHDSLALELTSVEARRFDWQHAHGAVIAASLHAGSHQGSAQAFVRAHADRLTAIPSWFVSVSLSAASSNPRERLAAERIAQEFVDSVGWTPRHIRCVAGRLAYTQYSFVTRWMMRRIARKEHGPTDTSRDHELTDWAALDADTRQFGQDVRESVCAHVRDEHYRAAISPTV